MFTDMIEAAVKLELMWKIRAGSEIQGRANNKVRVWGNKGIRSRMMLQRHLITVRLPQNNSAPD